MPTTFEELHNSLRQAEATMTRLTEANAEQALDLITNLDRAKALIEQLIEQGARYPAAEIQRTEIIESFLRRKMSKVADTLKRAGVSLEAVAAERAAVPDGWWWHINDLQRQQQQAGVRKLATTAGIILLAVAVIAILMNTVFKPDPLATTRLDASESAERIYEETGDAEAAIEPINEGLAKIDEILQDREEQDETAKIELWVLRGVLMETLGRDDEAAADFAQAEDVDPWTMYANRLQYYLMLTGDTDKAIADGTAMIELRPEHPVGYMLLGDAYWTAGDTIMANTMYSQCEEYAMGDESYSEIFVLVRQRQADLSQQMFVQPVTNPEEDAETPEE
jgi:tetratricopeptide (TPR) repeat protein